MWQTKLAPNKGMAWPHGRSDAIDAPSEISPGTGACHPRPHISPDIPSLAPLSIPPAVRCARLLCPRPMAAHAHLRTPRTFMISYAPLTRESMSPGCAPNLARHPLAPARPECPHHQRLARSILASSVPVLGKRQSPSLGAFPRPHRPASLHATFRVLGSWFPPASSVRAPTMPDVAVTNQVPERNPVRSRVVSIPPCHSTRPWVLSSCLALPYASCVHLSHFRDAIIPQEDALEHSKSVDRSRHPKQGWSSASTSIMAHWLPSMKLYSTPPEAPAVPRIVFPPEYADCESVGSYLRCMCMSAGSL